jgi:hypothetical protein
MVCKAPYHNPKNYNLIKIDPMKTFISTLTFIALATSLHAQYYAIDSVFNGQYKAAELNLTLTLTKSTEIYVLDLKDELGKVITPKEKTSYNEFTDSRGDVYEYRTQIAKAKYGNAELLKDMVSLEVIPEVTGWSIVYLYDNTWLSYSNDEEEMTEPVSGVYGVYLKKKQGTGFVLKDVSEYLSLEPYGSSIETEAGYYLSYVDAYNYVESNNYETNVFSYKETSSTFGGGELTAFDMNLKGASTVSTTWDATNQIYKDVPTVKGLIGGVGYDDEYDMVWDGTVSGSFATIGNLATYQSAIESGYDQ